jgi:hypothetical protein
MDNPILFAQVKRKLNITWDDTDTTNRVNEIIASAIPDMLHKLGIADAEFDFSVSGAENTLFLAYCLYEWNHALSDFDLNYERMIAQVRAQHEVAYYLAKGEVSSDAET